MPNYKRTLVLSVAALLTLFGSVNCNAFQEKTEQSKAKPNTDLAEIEQIASDLIKDRKAVLKYHPSWNQCRALVKTRSDAINLYECTNTTYRGIVRDGGLKFPAKLKKFDIEQSKLKEFSGDKADRFRDFPIFELAWSENGETTFSSCFIKVNDEWAYFPMPWKHLIIPDAKLPGWEVEWIRMLHNEQYEDAYQFAAPILRKAYPFARFRTYAKSLGLKDVADLTFTMQAGEARNSEWALIREGNLDFNDGTHARIALTAIAVKDEGAFPFQISIERVYGADESAAFVPPKSECEKFSRVIVSEIVKSIKQNDFTEFHEQYASYDLKQQADPEKFKSVFSRFADTDFSFLKNATFTTEKFPRYKKSFGGCVEFDGSFRDPETKNVLGFFISATESFKKWKVNSISFYPVRQYDPEARIPVLSDEDLSRIASSTTDKFIEGISTGSFESLLGSMPEEIRSAMPENQFKTAFAFLLPLFEDESKLGDPKNLTMRIRASQLDLDHLKMSTSLKNASNDNWLKGDFEYWFQEGEWKLVKVDYKY